MVIGKVGLVSILKKEIESNKFEIELHKININYMFDEILALTNKLVDVDVTKYSQVRDARKTLQEVKVMCKVLRDKLSAEHKASKVK